MSAFRRPLAHEATTARCNCNIAVTSQPLLMKVPSSKLARSLLQLGLRVHHDRSIPGDGVPERFPRDEQKYRILLFASLDRDLIAT
jgi:hypothetical protein